eukprot:scaffold4817_cov19-Tisochrysis_lutea.AAC.5
MGGPDGLTTAIPLTTSLSWLPWSPLPFSHALRTTQSCYTVKHRLWQHAKCVWLLWIVCTEDYQAYQGINHARVSRIGLAAMDRLYGGPGAQRWQNLDTTGQGSPVGQVRCAQEEACKFFLMG